MATGLVAATRPVTVFSLCMFLIEDLRAIYAKNRRNEEFCGMDNQ
jgi:hypothetical protein